MSFDLKNLSNNLCFYSFKFFFSGEEVGLKFIKRDPSLTAWKTPERLISYSLIRVLITTAQLCLSNPELRFCAGSNSAHGVSEICDSENLWQWSRLKIRLNVFCWSNILQKQSSSSWKNKLLQLIVCFKVFKQ